MSEGMHHKRMKGPILVQGGIQHDVLGTTSMWTGGVWCRDMTEKRAGDEREYFYLDEVGIPWWHNYDPQLAVLDPLLIGRLGRTYVV